MSAGEQSAGRRLSLITIDQAIAGASNVLIAVLAARLLGVASFGLFGIVFLVYVVVQCVSRALVCDPQLVHPAEAEQRRGEVIGTSCLLGLGLGVVVLACGLAVRVWGPELGDALVVLAVCIPLLVLQDLGRYLGFGFHKPGRAIVLDMVWLVLLFGSALALFVSDTRSLAWFIGAWAGSGAAAGLLLFTQHPIREVRLTLAWLRYTWPFSWRYLVSYTSTQGAALAASSGVGAIAGARALGGLQGALLLVRPYVTFQLAATAAAISDIARMEADHRDLRRDVNRTSALAAGVAVVNAIVLLVLPEGLGRLVLGPSWSVTQPLLLPISVQIVFLGLTTGVRAGLLGVKAVHTVVRIDVAGTFLVLVATLCGAYVNGVLGALWAVAIAQAVMSTTWWLAFRAHAADKRAARDRPAPPLEQRTAAAAGSSNPSGADPDRAGHKST